MRALMAFKVKKASRLCSFPTPTWLQPHPTLGSEHIVLSFFVSFCKLLGQHVFSKTLRDFLFEYFFPKAQFNGTIRTN